MPGTSSRSGTFCSLEADQQVGNALRDRQTRGTGLSVRQLPMIGELQARGAGSPLRRPEQARSESVDGHAAVTLVMPKRPSPSNQPGKHEDNQGTASLGRMSQSRLRAQQVPKQRHRGEYRRDQSRAKPRHDTRRRRAHSSSHPPRLFFHFVYIFYLKVRGDVTSSKTIKLGCNLIMSVKTHIYKRSVV